MKTDEGTRHTAVALDALAEHLADLGLDHDVPLHIEHGDNQETNDPIQSIAVTVKKMPGAVVVWEDGVVQVFPDGLNGPDNDYEETYESPQQVWQLLTGMDQ